MSRLSSRCAGSRVHRFLPDETEYLLFQFGFRDLIAIVAHAIHEEAFARGEQQRERVEEMRDVRAEPVPVAGAIGGQGETEVAA